MLALFGVILAAIASLFWGRIIGNLSAHPTPLEVNTQATPTGSGQMAVTKAQESFAGRPRAAFRNWVNRWEQADPAQRAALLAEGINLAQARREVMKALIREDPETALAEAIPYARRIRLPPEIVALLEEPISAAARFEVAVGCALEEGQVGREERFITVGDRVWETHTFGRRLDVSSKYRLSAIGIAIDDQLALADEPARVLPAEEVAARGLDVAQVWAESMGEIRAYSDTNEVERWAAALREAEGSVDPAAAPKGGDAGGGVGTFSAYTEGAKSLLYIICDFPNLTGFPVSVATVSNAMNNVTSYLYEASFGKFRLNVTYVPEVVRLPQNGMYYTNRFSQLLADARAGAQARGYDPNAYDFYIVLTDENTSGAGSFNFLYAGMAWVGAPGLHLVHPNYTLRTAGHEFGHNLGLQHANYWRTDSDTPIGRDSVPGGYVGDTSNAEWIEYGHRFTIMSAQTTGDMNDRTAHFAPREKLRLDWIATGQVAVVTNSRVVRLYRFDHRTATGGPFAIHIKRPSSDYTGNNREYWLGYRMAYVSNAWLRHGVQVDWIRTAYGSDGAIQLDMSPFSHDSNSGTSFTTDNNDKWDGALLLGRTYSDHAAGIHFTPVARGGTAPQEWIDVQLHIDPAPGNRPPTLLLTASATNAAVNGDLVFTAEASDPDGDELVYSWDFDQPALFHTQSLNRAVATNRWSAAGEYRVTCVVSDMKGGRGSAAMVVKIGNTNTFRIAGRVTHDGSPIEGVRVWTSHTNWTRTTSDGMYEIVNLRPASRTVRAQQNTNVFQLGFDNPVVVGPSKSGLDFAVPGPPSLRFTPEPAFTREGEALRYTIRLASRPTTNLVIHFNADVGQLTGFPSSVTITPNAWIGGTTVEVAAVNDLLSGPPARTTIVAHVVAGADSGYSGRVDDLLIVIEEDEAWDSDRDGIPDWWELLHFGDITGAAADGDADADNLSNLEEYIAGTHPIDAASYFKAQLDRGTELGIGVETQTGRVYSLFYTTNLTDGSWMAVPGEENRPGTGSTIWMTAPNLPEASFRVEIRLSQP